ncbi:hypothetical protein [Natronorubrum sp. A-ect3]|uniref:hypothetical protein n=1 Tax=Natronorubrum sp. A-ect3 TaxID=3242698 RepID=UPI00359D2DE3
MPGNHRDRIPLTNRQLIAVAAAALFLFGIVTTQTASAAAFTSDTVPDAINNGGDDELEIDTTVTDTTVIDRILAVIPDFQTLAVVDTVDDTYEPGDTVALEFTDTAHTSCDDAEFMVEVREPGSSTTDLSASDDLAAYDNSVMTDQLITGDVTVNLPSDAPDGEWEAAGFLYCHDDDSWGDIDGDHFVVEAPEPGEPEPGTVTRWVPDDAEGDCVTETVEQEAGDGYDTQQECLEQLPDDTGDDADDTDDDSDTDDNGDDDTDRHWLDQAVIDLWNRLTGWL